MLKRRKNDKDDISQDLEPDPTSVKRDPVTSFSPVSTDEKTIIGQHIAVDGIIRGKENLVIEGTLKGSIELEKHHVTVGAKGQVEAEIQADSVTIGGHLKGNIQAHGKVEITKDADFNGEIKAKRISVEDGAYLKAVIELERDAETKQPAGGEPSGKITPVSGKTSVAAPLESIKGS